MGWEEVVGWVLSESCETWFMYLMLFYIHGYGNGCTYTTIRRLEPFREPFENELAKTA
jgi:hypothetical protein